MLTPRIALLLAALACCGPVHAQLAKWNLPAGGVAIYTAEEALEPDPARGILPGCPLPHATILLQSELAAEGTHVEAEPQDWRWIAPLIAFDLRLGPGRVSTTLERVPGLGTLELSGTAGKGDDDTQKFDLTFTVARPVLLAPEKKLQSTDPRPWYGGEGTGALSLERKLDAKAGVVREFRAKLTLKVIFGPHHGKGALTGVFTQHWQLDQKHGYRDEDFRERVAKAIADGADVIEDEMRVDRPEFATTEGSEHRCGEGQLALCLQTLLVAGRAADSPKIRAGFEELHKRNVRETYSLAVALLATEQAYAPPREREFLLSGALEKPTPRALRPEDQKKVAQWTERLLGNRDESLDQAYRSRWWYLGGKGFDNSNSQYALLGLWSASLCRQQVSRGVWLASAEHWLAAQYGPDGRARELRLVPLSDSPTADQLTTARAGQARAAAPRGFSYTLPGSGPAYGSMTCAGIAGMSLCRAALDTGTATALDGKLDDAIRAAFAWLSAHRSVRWNPGPPPLRNDHYFYWLYSLERACELSRTGLIDDWDWYHDGAQVLLAMQDHNGKFGPAMLNEQCFAVLFLKKAQLPVLTGPR